MTTESLGDMIVLPDGPARAQAQAAIDSYNANEPAARAAARKNLLMMFLPFCIAAIGLMWFLLYQVAENNSDTASMAMVVALPGSLAGAFFVWKIARQPQTLLRQETRNQLLPKILGFAGEVGYRHKVKPGFMAHLPPKAVIKYDHVNFDDVINGSFDGAPYELAECEFTRSGSGENSSRTTIFKGVIMHFPLANPFPGEFYVSRRSGLVGKLLKGLGLGDVMPEVLAKDPWMRTNHDVRSSETGRAQALVDGPLGKVMHWLAETWPDGVARVVLRDGDGYLFLPSAKNFFELPKPGVVMDYAAHGEPMARELAILLATARLVRKAV